MRNSALTLAGALAFAALALTTQSPSDGASVETVKAQTQPALQTSAASPSAVSRVSMVTEIEDNGSVPTAQVLPISSDGDTEVNGAISPSDEQDNYRMLLYQGDVLGIAVLGPDILDPVIEIYDSAGVRIKRNDDEWLPLYPLASPFPVPLENLDAAVSFVAPATAEYILRVTSYNSASSGTYTMKLKRRRPFLESQPSATRQIIFVDFNGTGINTMQLFNQGSGLVTVPGLSNYLAAWGLTAADETVVIDECLSVINQKFDQLRLPSLNGNRPSDGIAGHFDVEFRNSRDHADVFGDPYVARLIIGGGASVTGISELVVSELEDPGNFNPLDTAMVQLDQLSAPAGVTHSVNTLILAPSLTKARAVGRAIGLLACHGLGHILGCFNTEEANSIACLMDDAESTTLARFVGVGSDNIFGSADDASVDFVADAYNNDTTFGTRFTQRTDVRVAYALATGGAVDPIFGVITSPPPAPRPDLTVTRWQIASGIVAGTPAGVVVDITNNGSVAATGFWASIFLNDLSPASSSGAAQSLSVAGLAPGETVTLAFTITYPAGGTMVPSVLVDSERQIGEDNEVNNVFRERIIVYSQGSDLMISSVARAETQPGLDATFTVTVQNRGATAVGGFSVGFWGNRYSAPSPADAADQTVAVAGLAAASGTTVTFSLPAQAQPSSGRAWFYVDYAQAITEDLETNNVAMATWGVANDPVSVTSPLSPSVTPAAINEPVTFTVGASDPNGDTIVYEWNFGDGSVVVGGASITHTYTTAGVYLVTVTLSDGPFKSVVQTFTLEVVDEELIDLGQVSMSSIRGRLRLAVPVPVLFDRKKDRPRSTLISGYPGYKVKYRNYWLRGKVNATGEYRFTIEHQSRTRSAIKRFKYKYTVVN